MSPTSITVCENCANFLPCIVQFDWLVSDQLRYLLNIYQFDCSVLGFPIENSSNKNTKIIHFLFYFPFWHLEYNEINEKFLKKAAVGISREIWCSNQETGKFDKKLETPGFPGKQGELAGM